MGAKFIGYFRSLSSRRVVLSIFLLFSILLGWGSATAHATANNQEIEFQGRLLNSQGATVPDGYYNIEFKLYENGDGKSVGDTTGTPAGTLLWTEDDLNANNQGVEVVNGYLSVELGATNPFGTTVDWSQGTLWLSMNVGSTSTTCTTFATCSPDGEMTPMQPLNSSIYAMNSQELGGLKASSFGQLAIAQTWTAANTFQSATNSTSAFVIQNSTATANLLDADTTNDRIGIGTLTPGYTLDVQGGNGINSSQGYSVAGTQVITSALALQNVTANASIITSGTLSPTNGGTGVNSSAAPNGDLLIGNGTGFTLTAVTNPANSNLSITSGAGSLSFSVVASPNFTTATVSGNNGLTLGSSGTTTGGITFYGANANSGSIVLSGPAGPASGSYTLSIPVLSANATLCTTAAVCSGYQPATSLTYVQLQSSTPGTAQTGSINITGTGTVGVLSATSGNAGTFSVGTGGLSSSGNISQSGTATLSTGTGAITLNGPVSVSGTNTLNVGSGLSSLAGGLTVSAGTSTFDGSVAIDHGASVAAGQSFNLLSGSGTFNQTYTNSGSGTAATWTITNANNTTTANTVSGQSIFLNGTAGGANTINGINFASVTPQSGNVFNGMYFGTGYNSLLNWEGNSLISGTTGMYSTSYGGTGVNASTAANGSLLIGNGSGFSLSTLTNPSGSNLSITNTSGAISLSVVSAPSFGSLSVTNSDGLSLGTTGVSTGGITFFGGNSGSGSIILSAPAGPASGNFTLQIPSITANANLCTDNSVCAGYAGISGDTNYIDIQGSVPGTAQTGNFNVAGTGTIGTAAIGAGGLTDSGNFAQSGTGTFSTASGAISLNGATSVTGSNSLTVGTGGATINGLLTANAGLTVKGNTLLQTTTNSATGFLLQNSSAVNILSVDTSAGILKVWDSSTTTPTNYASVSYANNTAVFAASSGVTQLGAVSGNVTIPLTGAGDHFSFTKTLTPTGSYAINDFSVQRVITGGSYSLTGAVMDVENRSTGTADATTVLNLNQNDGSASGGYILQAQNTGANVLTISNSGVIDTMAAYQINGSTGINASCATGQAIVGLSVGGGIATAGSCGTVLTEDLVNNLVQIGSSSGTQQIDLALDQYSTFTDNGYCNTAGNPNGSLYYNSASSSIRSCIGGNWQDLVNGSDSSLFGVVPSSGSNPGDLASLTTAGVSGPCKVSWASTTSVAIAPCTAYSSGRKVIIPQTTIVISGMTTTNVWEHICLTGSNDQPALSTAGTSETANLPSFSASAPVLCLADIQGSSGTANNIAEIYDVRTFTTTSKEFVNISGTAVGLGQMVVSNATGGTQSTAAAGASNVLGVAVATNGGTSTGAPNAIVAVQGPAYVKAAAGTSGDFVQTSGTAAGYASASSTTASFGSIGIARNSFNSSCTSAATCLTSLYFNETISY